MSVAYHSFRGRKLSFSETGIILDEGNIAILPDERLSWNALLFAVTGSEAEALARNGSKPTANMQKEMSFLTTWLKSLGATYVTPASELYIRHAGNVTGVVEPLIGAQMLRGGVPATEALGTFSYHFDVRGGIPGIGDKAKSRGWFKSLMFQQPTFNIGIRHALMNNVPNLAVVSPCSGFEGLACAVGRIVEFNVAVGQGVGIAAVNAILNNKNLADISNREVRQVLVETGQLPKIFGVANNTDGMLLAQFETLVSADAIA
ncbi:FAD-dependent oxidoreductase [Microcoleus sp. PH2017_05_CCC_O_A]|uniref:FAD-dependent oxidoreductase n=1 Tax=Microcoleus sp. PH2017_05_CCC_O_A TaxID=2798816 RepID=UPI0025F30623|nr:FAD-dependent oxidoreductase [Microcoleus sp. PH2017_05_CCC_O_A]